MRRICVLLASVLLAACQAATPAERFDRDIARDPRAKAIMDAMRIGFPDDYRQLREAVIGQIAAGDSVAAITETEKTRLNAVLQQHRPLLAQAPMRHLDSVLDTQITAGQALEAYNVNLCAAFALGRAVNIPPGESQVLDATSATTVATLRAMHAAQERPVAARPSAITASEIAALRSAMQAAGAERRLIDAAIGTGLANFPPDDQCRGSIALMRALQALPTAARDKIFRTLLRSS